MQMFLTSSFSFEFLIILEIAPKTNKQLLRQKNIHNFIISFPSNAHKYRLIYPFKKKQNLLFVTELIFVNQKYKCATLKYDLRHRFMSRSFETEFGEEKSLKLCLILISSPTEAFA